MIKTSNNNEIIKSRDYINSVIPRYANVRVTLIQIIELTKKKYVVIINTPEILYQLNDIANVLSKAELVKNGYINSTTYDGTGEIVLIIGSGIDWSHKDIQKTRKPNTSRILNI